MKMTFSGFIELEELQQWAGELAEMMPNLPPEFYVLADMRGCQPLPEDAQQFMSHGQKAAVERGVKRTSVILDDLVTTLQFKRIGRETGMYPKHERYFNAEEDDWEPKAMDWLVKGIDPEA
ncbi:MAG: hypothetical protein GY832_02805 [Chloroflexi bacterium]|nr:hypothetical protein [Chloroflexota bacterium]